MSRLTACGVAALHTHVVPVASAPLSEEFVPGTIAC